MPDKRSHRGPHPEDAELFHPDQWPRLVGATGDLCWLLSRGYAPTSALKLVGDRYQLAARQRTAVGRCACSDENRRGRQERRVDPRELRGRTLWLDGYNVLTTVEAALSDAVILAARDGTYRDMASMHGSYRKVDETAPALARIGRTLAALEVAACRWLLDRPVSNSGRLKQIIQQTAAAQGWHWQVELVQDPDVPLARTDELVATADSAILDACGGWVNLAREVVDRHVAGARIVDLGWADSAGTGRAR